MSSGGGGGVSDGKSDEAKRGKNSVCRIQCDGTVRNDKQDTIIIAMQSLLLQDANTLREVGEEAHRPRIIGSMCVFGQARVGPSINQSINHHAPSVFISRERESSPRSSRKSAASRRSERGFLARCKIFSMTITVSNTIFHS